ncbi:heavy-metal-associated domain-containing protein [Flagellimonas flava]|uniref:Copper chaperone CopZ n=1 Tax=Flagellimonas flava TaxID=570519 RepID=A0A1M5M9N8_9FLAO|nr:heavy-metal-associated domain-containing protein [Allomuricauda flava]SHG74007.1 Copper chaperone CopZ [Allomuricauda flava]
MKTVLQVQNLKCGGCANTIADHLNKIEGMESLGIEAETASITLEHQDAELLQQVKTKLKTLGYPVVDEENGMLLKAKSYVSCAIGKLG